MAREGGKGMPYPPSGPRFITDCWVLLRKLVNLSGLGFRQRPHSSVLELSLAGIRWCGSVESCSWQELREGMPHFVFPTLEEPSCRPF